MSFLKLDNEILTQYLMMATKQDLKILLEYSYEFLSSYKFSYIPSFIHNKASILKAKKQEYIDLFVKLFNDEDFILLIPLISIICLIEFFKNSI